MPDIETSSADYASRFAGQAGRYLLNIQTRTIEHALRGLQPGTVLDVGGAHGQLVEPLRHAGWQVTVQGSHEQCEANLRELHGQRDCGYVTADFFDLPFAEQSFDLVIAVRLLSHVEDWPRLIAEMCRVARHAVVLDYPGKFSLNALAPVLFRLKKNLEGNTRTYRTFSQAELQCAFARHGFASLHAHKQFFLPMVVHRVARGAAPLRWTETLARALGLTALAGSPAILVARKLAALGAEQS